MENSIMVNLLSNYGYMAIFFIILLEYANLPIPSEIVLPIAGMIIIPGELNLSLVIIVSIIGGVVGSITNYWIGFKFGDTVVEFIISKLPNSKKSFKASYNFFEKYNNISVFLARLVPIARTIISIVAGTLRMNLFKFIIFSGIGISIWNTILIILGYVFYDNIVTAISIVAKYSLIVKLFLIPIGIIFIFIKIKQRSKKAKNTIDN